MDRKNGTAGRMTHSRHHVRMYCEDHVEKAEMVALAVQAYKREEWQNTPEGNLQGVSMRAKIDR